MDHFSQRPLSRDGFEIAIICALPLEANAVLCAMDEIWHDSRHYYGKIAGDDNCYDFGRVGLHNVVIVTLPSMGLVRASSASRSLKMSFSSIKLALLVGICGAVPYSKDGSEILLGDVIIGETIVELDYGRQYPGSFKRKDTLLDVHGRPNEEILGLLQRWKVPVILEALRAGSMWHLRCLLQRLGIDYPGVNQDILFQPDDLHTYRGNFIDYNEAVSQLPQSSLVVSCTDVSCNTSQIVARHRLEQTIRSGRRFPDPAIHIGSIGTSNAVMKSAWHRDQHAALEGVIGFEMEGAGVWDKFNCLVIKGVCDYADSHKNKIWQPYAAATAAAVAKEVLNQYVMPQNVPQSVIPNNHHFSSCMHITSDNSHVVRGFHNSASVYSFDSTINELEESPARDFSSINAKKLVLESLRFPQMHERAQQIESAHEKTYSWIFQTNEKNMRRWDDPVAWLSSSAETRRIYWISGKPGAGKSTLMRFLREKLNENKHMSPWSQGYSVIRASYYSWSPGNKLQKSLEGLLRSLLFQILEKKPDLIPDVIDDTKWSSAQMSLINFADWSNLDLLSSLERCIQGLQGLFIRVLFFVDGLDEFESSDDTHQNLMDVFTRLTCTPNVKIFASSRPWNVFKDSFIDSPQLRLQDLTWGDVNLYVREKFLKNPRFQYLLRSDGETAQALIRAITNKAEGVFLWVRLVVRDLLKAICDGDSVSTLFNKLEGAPSDLNDYLKRLISLIDPQHMREASIILQVALYEERDFSSMHPLRLLDLSFIDDVGLGSPSIGNFKYSTISLNDLEGLKFRLDSTIRRLNSRCMGLLECRYDPEGFLDLFDEDGEQGLRLMGNIMHYQGLEFEPSIYSEVFDSATDPLRVFMPTVDFLHRCCRDFLLAQEMQSFLHHCTDGPYDAIAFIVNARTSQFLALLTAESDYTIDIATGIASYLMSALSVPELKNTSVSIQAARILQPVVEAFVDHDEVYPSMWYIGSILNGWHEEQSSFLTMSIDFDLRGYYMEYLTETQVINKKGRPILDYVLRPRFEGTSEFLNIGNTAPRIDLLNRVLDFGANPNGLYRGVSVWLLFLSSMADLFRTLKVNIAAADKQSYLTALRMMIDRGAALVLPCSWMSNDRPYKLCRYESFHRSCQSRWPATLPIVWQDSTLSAQPGYAVSDLLETFRAQLGQDIDLLIALARTKMEFLGGIRVQTSRQAPAECWDIDLEE